MLNEKGFTIVEGMVAMVVLLLVFMGLMQSALVAIDVNLKNSIKEEAVSIARMQIDATRSIPFNNLLTGIVITPPSNNFTRTFGNNINVTYSTSLQVNNIGDGTENRTLTMFVSWGWRGIPYNFTTSTVRTRV